MGGGSVMMWSGFSRRGKLTVAFCSPKMNSEKYQDMLAESLLPFGPLITNGEYVFQQDNAPIHRSDSTQRGFIANSVELLSWPPCSPDLNPIENLWGYLVRKVYGFGRQFTDVSSLKKANVCAWSEVT